MARLALACARVESFPIPLPGRETVDVTKCVKTFVPWLGEVTDTYGGKAVVDYGGEPAFAELAIVFELRDAGWDAVWIDTYGAASSGSGCVTCRRFRSSRPVPCGLRARGQRQRFDPWLLGRSRVA